MLLAQIEKFQQVSNLAATEGAIIQNTVWGGGSPFKVVFIIRGIGYRAALVSKTGSLRFHSKEFFSVRLLLIRVGYSYPVYLPVPNYIGIKINKKDRKLVIYGSSVEQVTTFAQCVYKLRPPSIYTGRGVRYKGHSPRRKLGKKDIRKGRFF